MLGQVEIFLAFASVMLGVSLLITVATQLVSAALNLRGRNLRTGLGLLLKECAPSLAKDSDALAEQVLIHPLISDSWFKHIRCWRLATAIRKDELRRVVESNSFAEQVVTALVRERLGKNETSQKAASGLLGGVDVSAAWEAARRKPSGQRGRALAEALFGKATDPLKAELMNLTPVLETLSTIPERCHAMDKWFESAMDRAAQRFSQSSRGVTIVASAIVCFTIHLDAFKLLEQLSTDTRLRTALVAASAKLERQYQDHAERAPANSTSAAAATGTRTDAEKTPTAPTDRSDIARSADAQRELQAGLEQIKSINAELAAAGLQLVPDKWQGFGAYWDLRHCLGMITAAALLSLGAPFWFNSLRAMSNLRPIVARREEAERLEAEQERVTPQPAGTAAVRGIASSPPGAPVPVVGVPIGPPAATPLPAPGAVAATVKPAAPASQP